MRSTKFGIDPLIGPEFYPLFDQDPLVLVDVGARHGFDRRWAGIVGRSRIVAFECDSEEHARLVASTPPGTRVTYLNSALHSTAEELDFRVARRPGGSSFLEPNWEFLRRFPDARRFETVRTIRMQTEPLDQVLERSGIHDVDLAKLDTQGTELAILQGAERLLATQLVGLEIEVSFAPMYMGQPLFCEVDSFVRQHGFILFDIKTTYWKRTGGVNVGGPQGQLVGGDALYLRDLPRLIDVLTGPGRPPESESRVRVKGLHAIAVALLYGYVDYAFELVDCLADRRLVTVDERARLVQRLSSQRPAIAWMPMFPGRSLLARSAHWWYRRLKTSSTPITGGWRLGNEC